MPFKADYANAASRTVGVEFCGTAIVSRPGNNAKAAERLVKNPHFIFAETERKGYGVAEFTPQRLTAALRVVDDVTRRETKIETLAKFAVTSGQAIIEKA